jgi:hypothetical protein
MITFEIGVYNKEVRDLIQQGDRHRQLSDDWADVHYVEVTASDETDARSKIARKYPPNRGYVVESISKSRF